MEGSATNTFPILVTGAAGKIGGVGRKVVELLRKKNLSVRAMVHREDERSQQLRDLGAEVVVGDLTSPQHVLRVVKGCRRIYFGMSVSPPYLEASVIMAAVAKEVGEVEVLVADDCGTDGSATSDLLTTAPTTLDGRASFRLVGTPRGARATHRLPRASVLLPIRCRIDRT